MSSTKRGGQRTPSDNYPTPSWVTRRFLEGPIELPGGLWYEPCAGEGAIIDVVNAHRRDVKWCATEIREEARTVLDARCAEGVWQGSALERPMDSFGPVLPKVIITNPPFSLSWEMLNLWLRQFPDAYIVILQRLNFKGSQTRHPLMVTCPPDDYIVPDRPAFRGDGQTDSIEYAWFVWGPSPRKRPFGRSYMLALTPLEERHASLVKEAR